MVHKSVGKLLAEVCLIWFCQANYVSYAKLMSLASNHYLAAFTEREAWSNCLTNCWSLCFASLPLQKMCLDALESPRHLQDCHAKSISGLHWLTKDGQSALVLVLMTGTCITSGLTQITKRIRSWLKLWKDDNKLNLTPAWKWVPPISSYYRFSKPECYFECKIMKMKWMRESDQLWVSGSPNCIATTHITSPSELLINTM